MMNDAKSTKKENKEAEVVETGEISPHNKAVYEAGKTVLIDSISTGREFCKFMIGSSTGAIPIYLGILAVLLPEKYVLGIGAGIVIALPAIAFLVASVVFTLGYLPVTAQFSLDVVEEIERERDKIIRYRSQLIRIGFAIFVLATLSAIITVVINIGVR